MYTTLTDARKAARRSSVNKLIGTLYIIYVPEERAYDVVNEEDLDTFYYGADPIEVIES